MDWLLLISVISLFLSIIAFISSTSLFQIQFIKTDIAVSLNTFDWIFDVEGEDERKKLQIDICNYSNRDILLRFIDGFAQTDKSRVKIINNQCVKLLANSVNHISLDIEPDYSYNGGEDKKLDLHYKKFGIISNHFKPKDFAEITPLHEIKSEKYIPLTHLFVISECIDTSDTSLIEKYIREDLDISNWMSVQDIKFERILDDEYQVNIKVQNNTYQTVSNLDFNLRYCAIENGNMNVRQRNRDGYSVKQDSIKIIGLEEYQNE